MLTHVQNDACTRLFYYYLFTQKSYSNRELLKVLKKYCSKIFFKKVLFIFRERVREGERQRETRMRESHQLAASHMPPTGKLACKPDWELNLQPFGLWEDTQPTDTLTYLSHISQGSSKILEVT